MQNIFFNMGLEKSKSFIVRCGIPTDTYKFENRKTIGEKIAEK